MITSKIFETRKGQVSYHRRTICELHRRIYDLCVLELQDNPEFLKKIISLLEEAWLYGLKMNRKLVENKLGLIEKEIAKPNTNFDKKEASRLRKERVRLTGMVKDNTVLIGMIEEMEKDKDYE